MEDFGLYIPTYKRGPDKQVTFHNLPPEWQRRTWLCVREEEEGLLSGLGGERLVLRGVTNIAQTRQAILEAAATRFALFLDDDLTFYHRPWQYDESVDARQRYKLRDPAGTFDQLFGLLRGWLLEGCGHVGVSMREGNNREASAHRDIGRAVRAVGYDLEAVEKAGARFREEVDTKEDLDMTLQMLRAGWANRISYEWAQGQPGSNTPGGCATYRDTEVMRRSSEALKSLHPHFVTLVTKSSKNWGMDEERIDVRIKWQRAFRESSELSDTGQITLL